MEFIWALIIVTYGATVSFQPFPGKASCEQGRSLALYGQTVEEKAEADAKAAKEAKEREEAYKLAHPEECAKDIYCFINRTINGGGGTFIGSVYDKSNSIKYARCVLVSKEEK